MDSKKFPVDAVNQLPSVSLTEQRSAAARGVALLITHTHTHRSQKNTDRYIGWDQTYCRSQRFREKGKREVQRRMNSANECM